MKFPVSVAALDFPRLKARVVRVLSNLSIRSKVMLVPAAALSGFLLYAAFSVMLAHSNARTLEDFSQVALPTLNTLSSVRTQQTEVRSLFTQAIGDSDEFLVEDALKKAGEVSASLDHLATLDPALQARLKPVRAQWATYVSLAKQTVSAQLSGTSDMTALQANAQKLQASYEAFGKSLGALQADQQKASAEALGAASVSAHRAAYMGVALVVLLALVVALASLAVDVAIRTPIERLRQAIRDVSAGRFSVTLNAEGSDAIAMMTRDFSALLANLNAAISETNDVVGAVARGDFSRRIQADLPGDLATLKSGVNASADSVARTMGALDAVMDAIARGDFSARMDAAVEGESRAKVDQAMGSLQAAFAQLQSSLARAAEGDFSARIESQMPGDLDALKRSFNAALDALDVAFSEISATTAALAEGDLTRRAQGAFSGRIADVTTALNGALDTLQGALRGVAITADEVGAGAGEIASGNADLAARTERQAASLERSAAAIEELASAVRGAAENSERTRSITRTASERAHEGAVVVSGANEAMRAITDATGRIAEIIGLIDSIAFQTNLLSLNAAVEAARAGEQGRGFAVVAAEVRSLAQRTTQSAKDIRSLIGTAGERVSDGNRLVTRSGESLQQIATSSEEIAALTAEASDSIGEQARGLQDVSEAISQLEESNLQNGALVEQVAASSAALSDQAARLRDAVSRFRLDAAPVAGANPSRPTARPRRVA